MDNKGLNTKQVGNLFGVDESTVRRWSLAGKIKCSSSAGGHRKFSYKDIIDFSKTRGLKLNQSKETLDKTIIINEILNHSLNNNSSLIELILIKLYLNGTELTNIMDDVVESTLINLQSKLDKKEISIAEEHIARKIISKSLNGFKLSIINDNSKNKKNILCLNLENDIPDLPIDMIQILLENINYNVYNCGSHTSIKDVKKLLEKQTYKAIFIYLCDRQCCTSTIEDNIKKTNKDLKAISILAKKYNIKLFLGGPSFKNINENVLKNFNKFTKYSEVLSLI
ncbi:MAG: hypothetical protein CMG66_05770 [Candidatus Marinimicrobia bacterium]|nr:hypothetical protein [Candidatus Neomarinimicrobiota bacterium]|tara:strand:- start:34176 stop:35021 length:846 start_codon:yes stop_codon:yes gene_type:complete